MSRNRKTNLLKVTEIRRLNLEVTNLDLIDQERVFDFNFNIIEMNNQKYTGGSPITSSTLPN